MSAERGGRRGRRHCQARRRGAALGRFGGAWGRPPGPGRLQRGPRGPGNRSRAGRPQHGRGRRSLPARRGPGSPWGAPPVLGPSGAAGALRAAWVPLSSAGPFPPSSARSGAASESPGIATKGWGLPARRLPRVRLLGHGSGGKVHSAGSRVVRLGCRLLRGPAGLAKFVLRQVAVISVRLTRLFSYLRSAKFSSFLYVQPLVCWKWIMWAIN